MLEMMDPVGDDLHLYRYGSDGPLDVLAIHGMAGHGQRWRTLAEHHLPEYSFGAPDLIGHGRSTWAAPWTLDANVSALAALLERESDKPVVVVGHSFGGMIALYLAAARPDLVESLVLLDPAVTLDGAWMREIAEAMLKSPDYADPNEARIEKATGAWSDVPPEELDRDLAEHLVDWPNGRVGWRICLPAMMSYWSELTRDIALPAKGTRTTILRATRTHPPYISHELLSTLTDQLGTEFTVQDLDCEHMVAHAKPRETAAVVREHLRLR